MTLPLRNLRLRSRRCQKVGFTEWSTINLSDEQVTVGVVLAPPNPPLDSFIDIRVIGKRGG